MEEQLIDLLGNCKCKIECLCANKSPFEKIADKVFFVSDQAEQPEVPVRIVGENEQFQLTVKNISGKEIILVKVDKCLLSDETRKCDCFIFDDSKFYLIEIKTSSAGKRGKRRKIAIEQLASTVETLITLEVDFKEMDVCALVCFKSEEPKITQASKNSAFAVFKEKYGIKLHEGNMIDF